MPAGPGPVGFAAFTGVKLIGYTLAAVALKRAFKSEQSSAFKVGLARTGIGLVVGFILGGSSILIGGRLKNPLAGELLTALFFTLLIPIRIGEWSLLIHWFFDRGLVERARDLKYGAWGMIWSFVLDVAGIVGAFVVPGGFWIC